MIKKEFTSFDVAAVVQELKGEIVESRVSKVYQLDSKTFVFKLHQFEKPPIRLVLEAGRRIHLTSYVLEPPQTPPAFCMALRKHLQGSWLVGVDQYEFERIVVFSFKTREGIMKLILEVFGEGNLVLISEKELILQALVYKRMRDRNIHRGEKFVYPPSFSKNPLRVERQDLENILMDRKGIETVRVLAKSMSFGGSYAEEILLRANVDKNKSSDSLSSFEKDNIFNALKDVLYPISHGEFDPIIVLDETGDFIDVMPFKLKRYEGCNSKSFQNFNKAVDEFFLKIVAVEKAKEEFDSAQIEREEEKIKRMISEQEKLIAESEETAEQSRKLGDMIYANANYLQTIMDKFVVARNKGQDLEEIVTEVANKKRSGDPSFLLFDSFDSKSLAINVDINQVIFSLSLRKNLYENAAIFYERSKRAKQKSEGARMALEESKRKLEKIEKKKDKAEHLKEIKPEEIINQMSKKKIKNKEWFEKFRWFISSENFLVVAGKDAVSNEVLIKKYTDQNDLVFHVDIIGSPFVVIKTEGKEPGEKTLRESSEFAAAFSRAWREGLGSIDVYWVSPDQLSKSGPSGEYVAHGAFAVTGKRNWDRGVTLQIAIGVMFNEKVDFIGGPLSMVQSKTKNYVTLVPGDYSGKDILSKILRSLTMQLTKEQKNLLGKISVESIREYVPYTQGRIMESKRN